MLRVFLGIKISQELYKRIKKLTEKYKNLPVRWIDEKSSHLTLVPPWNIQSNEVDKIIKELKTVQRKFHPFKLKFSQISYGPDPKHPRLIWVMGMASKEMIELKRSASLALGRKEEKREFIPHLTLARFQ